MVLPSMGSAASLQDALREVYENSPTLAAARASVRIADDAVVIQLARARPIISTDASISESPVPNHLVSTPASRTYNAQLSINAPVFSGGETKQAIRASERRVFAARSDLSDVEGQVFVQVVAAYMDVTLNRAAVDLHQRNVTALELNLKATIARFAAGDLTRTDVAQSSSRLALAKGDLIGAQSTLIASEQHYLEVIGVPARNLTPPSPLPAMPGSEEEAVRLALSNSPSLAAAKQRLSAARYDVKSAESKTLPRVSLYADYNRTGFLGSLRLPPPLRISLPQNYKSLEGGVRINIPIYQGGQPAAERHQTQDQFDLTSDQEIEVERSVVSTARSAWTAWQAANQIVATSKVAVNAAEQALTGVRAENAVGTRTILDILNAEQEKLSAEVQLATANRNAYVAGANLLEAIGGIDFRYFGVTPGERYDPIRHYEKAKRTISDW